MKKLCFVLISCVLVVGLVYTSTTTSVIYDITKNFVEETPICSEVVESAWYFKGLNNKEADIYKRITTVVNNYDKDVVMLSEDKISVDNINRAFEAFLLDNPEVFFIDNEINIEESVMVNAYKYRITLNYSIDDSEEIEACKKQIDYAISEIINKLITSDMNDFEKELAIHDYIASQTKYYEYADIKDIPHEKHNIYSALIDKEAVCDGFSKVFQVILKRLGIEAIMLTGSTNTSNHAWNKVKLEDKWYNVDVTSDSVTVDNAKLATHVYFNVDDKTISTTHKFNNNFEIPESNSNKYNYYTYLDYEIHSYEQLSSELNKIIKLNKSRVLEFKIINQSYDKQEIIDEIFKLNFNNYRENNVQSIEYFYQDNIYMFVKDKV